MPVCYFYTCFLPPISAFGWLILGVAQLLAQGQVEGVLRTGSGQALTTIEKIVPVPGMAAVPALQFHFGFGTQEQEQPGEFLDSLTVTIINPITGLSGALLTADASGVLWGPPNPGGFQVDDGAVRREIVDFQLAEPGLPKQSAYFVRLELPSGFRGENLKVSFDLFDNQDGQRSVGYFSELTIVPEPSAVWILWSGVALLGYLTKHRSLLS